MQRKPDATVCDLLQLCNLKYTLSCIHQDKHVTDVKLDLPVNIADKVSQLTYGTIDDSVL